MTRRTMAALPILAVLGQTQEAKKLTACKTCKWLDRQMPFTSCKTPHTDAATLTVCYDPVPTGAEQCLHPSHAFTRKERNFDWYEGTEEVKETTIHPLAASINDGKCKTWEKK